jgi:hypothetical protein
MRGAPEETKGFVIYTTGQYVIIWLSGLILATLIAWMVTPFFVNSIHQWRWHEELNRFARPVGYIQRWRSEGWGETHYGWYSISAIEDIREVEASKAAIWGDSFVEAFQVDDPLKMSQQLTRLWSRKHPDSLVGVAVGNSGWSVSDYYFLIPRYEEIFLPVCHFIIVSNLTDDICPDGQWFKSEPVFSFKEREPEGDLDARWRQIMAEWKLEFFYYPLRTFTRDIIEGGRIRFRPGPVERKLVEKMPVSTEFTYEPPLDAWLFAVQSLQRQTNQPVVFIYAPRTPKLEEGRLVQEDPYGDWAEALEKVCMECNAGFIDMTPAFRGLVMEEGLFPRGFDNGLLSEGHFNRHGHRLIAKAMVDYLEAHALYPD